MFVDFPFNRSHRNINLGILADVGRKTNMKSCLENGMSMLWREQSKHNEGKRNASVKGTEKSLYTTTW